jgi:glycosyltransferase involved in cell wall biosynthesis
MRILKVTQAYAPFFEFGGPPAKVRALAEGLVARGHEVTVLTPDWGLAQRLKDSPNAEKAEASPFGCRWRSKGVTAEYLANWLHVRALSWNPALGRYLKARLKAFQVAHIFGLYDLLGPRAAAECRKLGIPYVVEPIGMFVPIVRNIRLKRLYHRIWGREMLAGAAAIVATAEQERDELISGGLPAEKIVLRRNGVEAPEHLPDGQEFRRRLGIADRTKVLLFLGRLSPKKSPDLLLQAFAGLQVEPGIGSVELVFVGPDEAGMRSKLQTIAKQAGVAARVHFCGPLDGDAKWAAYRAADLFVLPSQNENFGNTAAEAVAAGTPVVVTDQCGIAPLLKDVAGLVVRHEEQDLRHALLLLLRDAHLYDSLRRGCPKAMAGLGWQEPIEQMVLIYSRLAARHGS